MYGTCGKKLSKIISLTCIVIFLIYLFIIRTIEKKYFLFMFFSINSWVQNNTSSFSGTVVSILGAFWVLWTKMTVLKGFHMKPPAWSSRIVFSFTSHLLQVQQLSLGYCRASSEVWKFEVSRIQVRSKYTVLNSSRLLYLSFLLMRDFFPTIYIFYTIVYWWPCLLKK